MQRNQDVVTSLSESADPVLWPAVAGIAHQFRAFGGTGDKRAERLERERRDAILDFQRKQPGPRNAEVQAIVGFAARDIGGIISRSGLEPYVPVFGGSDLRRRRLRCR